MSAQGAIASAHDFVVDMLCGVSRLLFGDKAASEFRPQGSRENTRDGGGTRRLLASNQPDEGVRVSAIPELHTLTTERLGPS